MSNNQYKYVIQVQQNVFAFSTQTLFIGSTEGHLA